MPDLDEQVYDALSQDPEIQALVGDAIWNLKREELNDKPAIVIIRVSTIPVVSSQGYNSLAAGQYQFDCWADKLELASHIAHKVKQVLGREFQAAPGTRRNFYDTEQCAYQSTIDMSVWGNDDV